MMHLNRVKTGNLVKFTAVIMTILIVVIFFRSLPFKESVQAFASLDKEKNITQDIYKVVIDKAIPIVNVSMNDGSNSESLAYNLFKYFTKIDIKNPRTYLASEIPLLGLYDITVLDGNANASAGNTINNPDNNKPEDSKSVENNNENKVNANFPPPEKPIDVSKIDHNNPAVIIYHTHSRETFTPSPNYNFKREGNYTSDNNYNNVRLGEEIKNYIESHYGFSVYHDTTMHDKPGLDFNGSYARSKVTIEKLVKKYPNVKFIIDLHRDAGTDRSKMIANIRGDEAAKVMFVLGQSNPHFQENYAFVQKLNAKLGELYPGLSKGFHVAKNRIYNQDVSYKSFILEIGADCNTLDDVLISSKMVARSIGEMLKSGN